MSGCPGESYTLNPAYKRIASAVYDGIGLDRVANAAFPELEPCALNVRGPQMPLGRIWVRAYTVLTGPGHGNVVRLSDAPRADPVTPSCLGRARRPRR